MCVCDCITFTDIEFVLLLSNVLFHPRALPGVLLFRQNRGIVTELYWGGGGGGGGQRPVMSSNVACLFFLLDIFFHWTLLDISGHYWTLSYKNIRLFGLTLVP